MTRRKGIEYRLNLAQKECRRCGITPRFRMAYNVCSDCAEVSEAIYKKSEKRRQQGLASMRRYYIRNRDRIKAKALAYYHAHKKAPP